MGEIGNFRGYFNHTLDGKGRVTIPARFREIIRDSGDGALMVSPVESFLVAYTMDEWTKVENRIQLQSGNSARMRRFRRMLIGRAFECALDKQDRILIPPALRELARLNKEVSLVGQINHFEIWSREEWDKETLAIQKEMENDGFMNEIINQGVLI